MWIGWVGFSGVSCFVGVVRVRWGRASQGAGRSRKMWVAFGEFDGDVDVDIGVCVELSEDVDSGGFDVLELRRKPELYTSRWRTVTRDERPCEDISERSCEARFS